MKTEGRKVTGLRSCYTFRSADWGGR